MKKEQQERFDSAMFFLSDANLGYYWHKYLDDYCIEEKLRTLASKDRMYSGTKEYIHSLPLDRNVRDRLLWIWDNCVKYCRMKIFEI